MFNLPSIRERWRLLRYRLRHAPFNAAYRATSRLKSFSTRQSTRLANPRRRAKLKIQKRAYTPLMRGALAVPIPSSPCAHLLTSNAAPSQSETEAVRNAVALAEGHMQRLGASHTRITTVSTPQTRRSVRQKVTAFKISQFQEFATKHNAILHPIRKLPLELLQHIFTTCVKSYPTAAPDYDQARLRKEPWTFSHVCRFWREATLSSGEMWSYIPLFLTDGPRPGAHNLLKETLLRTRGHRLTLDLYFALFVTSLPPSSSDPFISLLVQYAEQWGSVFFSQATHECLASFSGVAGRLTNLHSLNLHLTSYFRNRWALPLSKVNRKATVTGQVTLFQNAPKLVEASVGSENIVLPWPQLTRFHINYKGACNLLPLLATDNSKIDLTPSPSHTITHLSLDSLNTISPLPDALPFPNLRTLELVNTLASTETIRALKTLQVPQLSAFHILADCSRYQHQTAQQFVDAVATFLDVLGQKREVSSPPLEDLSVHCYAASGPVEISSIISVAPFLKRLCITQPTEGVLKAFVGGEAGSFDPDGGPVLPLLEHLTVIPIPGYQETLFPLLRAIAQSRARGFDDDGHVLSTNLSEPLAAVSLQSITVSKVFGYSEGSVFRSLEGWARTERSMQLTKVSKAFEQEIPGGIAHRGQKVSGITRLDPRAGERLSTLIEQVERLVGQGGEGLFKDLIMSNIHLSLRRIRFMKWPISSTLSRHRLGARVGLLVENIEHVIFDHCNERFWFPAKEGGFRCLPFGSPERRPPLRGFVVGQKQFMYSILYGD